MLTTNPYSCPFEHYVAVELLSNMRRRMEPKLRNVLGLRLCGYTLREIGDEYCMSPERVRMLELRARGELGAILGDRRRSSRRNA